MPGDGCWLKRKRRSGKVPSYREKEGWERLLHTGKRRLGKEGWGRLLHTGKEKVGERGLGKVASYRKRVGWGKVASSRKRDGRRRLLAAGKG